MSSDLAVPLACGRPVKVAAAAEDGVFAVLLLDVQHGLLDPALPLLLGFLLPKLPLLRRGIVKEAELHRLLRLAQDILLAHDPVGGDGQAADPSAWVGLFVIDAEHGVHDAAHRGCFLPQRRCAVRGLRNLSAVGSSTVSPR